VKRLFALLALVPIIGCRGNSKVHRTSDEPPVQVVKQPALPDAGAGHGGPAIEEVEPNDTDDVATPLPLGGTARGKIEPDTDVDRYRIDVDRPGALSVLTTAVDADLVVEIEDASGTVLARSARGGPRLREGVPNLGVVPGRYFAVVRAAPKKPIKKPPKPKKGAPPPAPAKEEPKPAPVYELTAQLAPPGKGMEVEPNDDRGTANELIVGDTVHGYVGWHGDADAWKLDVQALALDAQSGATRNAIALEVAPVEGVALELEVDDAAGAPLLVRKGARGDGVAVHRLSPQLAQGAPPYLYVFVRGDRSNPETAYALHVEANVVRPDDELEPNDTPERAYAIPADRQNVNGWWDYGDVDCYAIATGGAASRAIELTITPSPELDLAAELYVDGKQTLKVDHPGKGASEKLGAQVQPGQRVVACVRAAGDAPTRAGAAYVLHVQDAAGDTP
jgi:hypothetical protein